ncbi:uncharacterized protein LOC133181237 isoform X1 [Saccostrea echinata]|uniref:uncharacterized protein LOC133181237 isoform X1 n=2 Tax=Saccostrea echinata TaxID=191078 RepID=UPI002A83CF3D|nr:uncharacterized protein LOC133181237 isoform X1 [Saccostrea echinata]
MKWGLFLGTRMVRGRAATSRNLGNQKKIHSFNDHQMYRSPTRKVFPAVSSFLALAFFSKTPLVDCPHQQSVDPGAADHNSSNKMSAKLQKAKQEALWGMFVADALAMPVHWYYNPADIKSGYGGWLTGYRAPEKHHPSSILTISATGGSGRSGWGQKSKPIIGDIILHDKLKYWTSNDRTVHYHQGMKPGDNTLNLSMALKMLQTMQTADPKATMDPRELRGKVLEQYVKFMTSPGSHNDTYAESFHRSFFKDWSESKTRPKVAEEVLKWAEERYMKASKGPLDHQLVSIGALVPAIPWIIHYAHKSESECAKATVDFLKLTHPESGLVPFIDIYARLLHGVLNGHPLKQEAMKTLSNAELGGQQKRESVLNLLDKANGAPRGSESRLRMYQSATSRLGSACYMEGAMSSMLFLALEFADDVNEGLLANANCGGENCHRGAALGALLGASAAYRENEVSTEFKEKLGSSKTGLTPIIEQLQA